MTGMRTDRYGLYGDLPSPHDGLQLWINKGKAYGGSRVDERRRREEVVRGKRKAGTLRDLGLRRNSTRHLTAAAGSDQQAQLVASEPLSLLPVSLLPLPYISVALYHPQTPPFPSRPLRLSLPLICPTKAA